MIGLKSHLNKMEIIDFIKEKFENKFDKVGQPYINHLFTVAKKTIEKYSVSDEVLNLKLYIIALLHDIFEDTDATEKEIRQLPNIDDIIIDVLKLLTRSKNDTYMQYIEKVATNELAIRVKLADLEHNMDVTRYDELDDGAFSLLKRYHKAWKYLNEKTKKYE